MKLYAYLFIGIASAALIGCASYKSHVADYRGPGEFGQNGGRRDGVAARRAMEHQAVRVAGDFNLAWPVDRPQLSQEFRPRKNRKHQGIDLRGPRGTAIRAAHEGRVIFAGKGFRGYGKMVIVEFSPNWASLYAHLDRIHVREGDRVSIGDSIGAMGRTGRATGVHLHFELMRDKLPVDPIHYLPDLSRVAGN